MTYCTTADLIDLYGEAEVVALTDRDGSGQVNSGVAETAIARAASEADSYLAARHRVPLSPAPPVLRGMIADMARYYLTGAAALETDAVVLRYRQATAWLQQAARGLAVLDAPQASAAQGLARLDPGRRLWDPKEAEDAP